MKKTLITNLLLLMVLSQANADNTTIDISGDNTDKTATSHSAAHCTSLEKVEWFLT